MILAAILGFYLISPAPLSSGWLQPSAAPLPAQQAAQQPPAAASSDSTASQSQTTPPQSAEHPEPAPAPNNQAPSSPAPATPAAKPHRHHKKPTPCSTSTAASSNSATASLKPCPPPKKVVHNGGSDEPKIQLSGGTDSEHAAQQGSTEQLTLATEENLRQIADRQLNPSQQEMVNQIKQFMEQSKTAVAAGDVERGHNLAMKARLLSDELVKP